MSHRLSWKSAIANDDTGIRDYKRLIGLMSGQASQVF